MDNDIAAFFQQKLFERRRPQNLHAGRGGEGAGGLRAEVGVGGLVVMCQELRMLLLSCGYEKSSWTVYLHQVSFYMYFILLIV